MRAVHPFPARMAPDTVSKWLRQLPQGARVLDPMCGSGVVLRQSIQLGHNALGYDVDPLSVLMSRVWTRKGKHARLIEVAHNVASNADKNEVDYLTLPNIRDCKETREFVEYWFADPQRNQLAQLVATLRDQETCAPRWVIDALYLSISRTIVTKQAGASLAWDVSHSRPHRKRDANDYDAITGFLKSAERLAALLDETELPKSARVRRGDCRKLSAIKQGAVDAIITSPPYLNAIDYLRGHKLSLIWMGFTIPELRSIRAVSVGTERASGPSQHGSIEVGDLRHAVPGIASLPNRQRAIVHRYANDADLIFLEMGRVLTCRGRIVLVLADSVMRGVEVQSSSIFEWIAQRNGFCLVEKEKREIPPNRRYLPINSDNEALQKRMRHETIQVFERLL